MVFMMILVIALSLIAVYVHPDSISEPDASEILDIISESRFRISDMSGLDDDAVVYLTDLLALRTYAGIGTAAEYTEELLEKYCRGHPYSAEIAFGDKTLNLGGGGFSAVSGASASYPVRTGGTVDISISIGRRRPSVSLRSFP